MFSELWIDPADVSPLVSGTLHRDAPVRIRFADSAVNLPDRVARGLVHALLAHYAGRVDFHLLTSNEVEKVEDGLRVSLAQLNREALNLDEGKHPTGRFGMRDGRPTYGPPLGLDEGVNP